VIFPDPMDFTDEALSAIAPRCGECPDGGQVAIAQVEFIYSNRPDLFMRADGSRPWFWYCAKCGGYCGAHRHTLKPLGTPAGVATRRARSDAHAAFDPLWQKRQRLSGLSRHHARGKGYKWLAAQLGIDAKACHIAEMDAATARRVVEICRAAAK
jgi:hypothetical protein